MIGLIRKIIPKQIIPPFMILLAVIPALTIYEGVAANLPELPHFEAPDWFIPVGFVCIVLIFMLALAMKDKRDVEK
ncbi:hypothetical protein [Gracilibacillus phocaeensis]|uniref:hypothetical protein n=1 Tax=Gracilibacillus phocaeensis TaxID=2042304 RepID=UPI001030F0EE|nr:hypothetical protein [Gracilibacillus phocaeensis]